ncbi:hypothetical protein VOLCADRAFT_65837 [Volvox carteri f. nagariensis]|uniref:3'(2'),5'-bisphosphate nucleotidase n=1 Tax=Volvox carteri f. nagariensis TaxID=3068 RepID=D8U9Y8_VOLCA|nr:uncharacterized protein VOLCADRAFT_65837 [Volvox carteri f. nagariensis]EFJ43494.1 hypothetical protein VOLCADRAFT_65837 [Volvox carteri f. nagariensis]|eukprot:XP_002955423.1 hypothetical protein VOLCADRAFT_65837 [Volvox carteri f. nagariensis]
MQASVRRYQRPASNTHIANKRRTPWRPHVRPHAAPSVVVDVAPQALQYGKELESAKAAVRLASKLCQIVQRQLSAEERVDKKDDSPVTVADYGAQAVVAWALQRADPSSRLSMVAEEDSAELRRPAGRPMLERITQLINSVISEAEPGAQLSPEEVLELIDLGGSPGGPTGRHWVLDPIDGTRGFVGMRQYAVCLGMLQDGEVVLGVLGCPNLPQGSVVEEDGLEGAAQRAAAAAAAAAGSSSSTTTTSSGSSVGCLFSAHRNHGAYAEPLWDESSAPVQIRVEDVSDPRDARFMESVESRHSSHSTTAAMARELGVVLPPLRMDSQVKYGLLSRGCASIFMRFPPPAYKEKIWDHAAGFVIVEEAGGLVTDAAGVRLDFSRGRFLHPLDRGIIAAPPALHEQLVKAATKVVPPSPSPSPSPAPAGGKSGQ